MDLYAAIEAKYGFALPEDYLRMQREGFLDHKNEGAHLWLHEMEWMSPEEILEHKPADFHLPGFIPFAFTGASDEWCWYPSADPKAIVYCPHDEGFARFDAPDFLGSVYRRCLDASLDITYDEAEIHGYYATWISKLAPYFPPAWIKTLQSIAAAPVIELYHGKLPYQALLSPHDYDAIIARDLAFPRLNEEFPWMTLE